MNKLNKFFIPVIIVVSIIFGGFHYASQFKKQKSIERQQVAKIEQGYIETEKNKCKFELFNIVENKYEEDKEAEEKERECTEGLILVQRASGFTPCILGESEKHTVPPVHKTYWEVDGFLKNKSKENQFLESIILKIYTDDERKILLSEGYLNVRKNLTPDQSYPFQVRAQINRDSAIGKYFKKGDEVRIDVYPYFNSCNY